MSATEHDFIPVARKFADDFIAWLEEHEREEHEGEKCDVERANILAFVAHCIGHRRQVFELMLQRLLDYDAMHDEHYVDE